MAGGPVGPNAEDSPGPVRMPLRLRTGGSAGSGTSGLLAQLRQSAFQGRKLGEAFDVWKRMIDGGSLICLGLAGSMSSAGMWPLVTWLVERGYVDLIASTSANVTEDLLEQRGVSFYQVDPDHVDDEALLAKGFYRFYDHVVSAAEYDRMEDLTGEFFDDLARSWPGPTIAGVRFMREFGRWLDARGLGGSIAAACYRHRVPLFVPAAPDGPLSEGYRTARRKGPVVDFFRDYEIVLRIMSRYMAPGRGTSASPHLAAIQITTDNTVFGGLSGAGVGTECISWGKESPTGWNVMVFADFTIALPLLCQGLLEHYGPAHARAARAGIVAEVTALLDD